MKYLFGIILFALSFQSCDTSGSDQTEVVNKDQETKESFTTLNGSTTKDGPYERKDLDGQLLESSNYKDGKLHGEQKLYEKGKLYSIANYNQGQITGKYQSFYTNGEVYVEGEYEGGAMNGKWKTYYETGQLKEVVYFVDNQENGPFVEFHTNGNVKAEGEYLNGDNEHGELFLYNPNGVLIQKMNCENGICRTTWKKEGNQGFPEDIRSE